MPKTLGDISFKLSRGETHMPTHTNTVNIISRSMTNKKIETVIKAFQCKNSNTNLDAFTARFYQIFTELH